MSQQPSSSDSPILGDVAARYVETHGKIKKLEKELETLKKALKTAATQTTDGAFTQEVTEASAVVVVTTMPGRKTLDTALVRGTLEDQGFDPDDFYKVGAPFVQISVKSL